MICLGQSISAIFLANSDMLDISYKPTNISKIIVFRAMVDINIDVPIVRYRVNLNQPISFLLSQSALHESYFFAAANPYPAKNLLTCSLIYVNSLLHNMVSVGLLATFFRTKPPFWYFFPISLRFFASAQGVPKSRTPHRSANRSMDLACQDWNDWVIEWYLLVQQFNGTLGFNGISVVLE